MMAKRRFTTLTSVVLGMVTFVACADDPARPIANAPPPIHQPFADELADDFVIGPDGIEYEADTGAIGCPNPITSNVQFPVSITNVGTKWFTFYAPHHRLKYLKLSRYRYRMTIGQSWDGDWLAEGPWLTVCAGAGRLYGGQPYAFEGTVWFVGTLAANDYDPCGYAGDDPGVGENGEYEEWTWDPEIGCGGNGSDGGGSQPPPTQDDLEWMCDYFDLTPGCYDVYVDGAYEGSVCC